MSQMNQLRRQALQLAFRATTSPAASSSTSAIGSTLIRSLASASSLPGSDGASVSSSWSWRAGSLLGLGFGGAAMFAAQPSALADAEPASTTSDPYERPASPRPLPKSVTLYQYEVCPYCCKVKAALDYYKIPYTVVEVNPLTKGEIKWSAYKKVPIIKMDDDVVNDSSAIMSRLAVDVEAASSAAAGSKGAKAASPSKAASVEEEAKWRKWVDTWLVKVLTANIYRNWGESVESFTYITDQTNWSWGTREVARWTGAVLMWQIGKRMPGKYGIEGDLRAALYAACDEWVEAVGAGRAFHGGDKPNLADLSVFGILRAVSKTGTFSDVMANSRIGAWYTAMEAAVGQTARLPEAAQ